MTLLGEAVSAVAARRCIRGRPPVASKEKGKPRNKRGFHFQAGPAWGWGQAYCVDGPISPSRLDGSKESIPCKPYCFARHARNGASARGRGPHADGSLRPALRLARPAADHSQPPCTWITPFADRTCGCMVLENTLQCSSILHSCRMGRHYCRSGNERRNAGAPISKRARGRCPGPEPQSDPGASEKARRPPRAHCPNFLRSFPPQHLVLQFQIGRKRVSNRKPARPLPAWKAWMNELKTVKV